MVTSAPPAQAPSPGLAHQRRPKRGRGHDAHDGYAVHEQGQQGGPDGYAADEVLGPVDGVDDPHATDVGCGSAAVLLAVHGVVGTGLGKLLPHEPLDGPISVADRREVRLGLDDEVERKKALQGQRIRTIGELERQSEVIGVRRSRAGHAHG